MALVTLLNITSSATTLVERLLQQQKVNRVSCKKSKVFFSSNKKVKLFDCKQEDKVLPTDHLVRCLRKYIT